MNDKAAAQHWRIETDDKGVAWLHFDKAGASANVLSGDVMNELDERLAELEVMRPRAAIIVSDKKSGFIAGADIKEFTGLRNEDQAFDLIRRGQLVVERLEKLPFPTVAAIHGFALGGGLELALACRYRVAADDPRTSLGLPEVKLGIHPGFGGTVRSVRAMGVFAAMDIMLTGRFLNARKARNTGLVDRLAPADSLREEALKLALKAPPVRRPSLGLRLANLAPARWIIASQMEKRVAKKARKAHYPAPYAIIDLWRRYGGGDMGTRYLQEAHSIARLMCTDSSRNLVRVFLLQDRLKSLGNKKDLDLKHLHVVGAGTMGGDIASWTALKGYTVTLQDRGEEYIKPALERARKLFERKLKSEDKVTEAMGRLKSDVEGNGVSDADVVIEAIFEDADAKKELYRSLEPKMKPEAVLATNTSSIRLENLRDALHKPDRLVGLHFFNPVAKMPLVEVIHTAETGKDEMARALAFTRHIDRLPVPVRSAPGFLVNRILMPYMMEAVKIAEEGVALEAIDRAALDFGMPMGPVELSDTVGLDVALSVAKIFAREFNAQIPERLKTLVEQKQLGRKTGRGFYAYVDGKPQKDPSRASGGPSDLQDRLILPMINEAVAVLREGIVEDADLLDAGVIFGTGFAPFRGGPIQYARSSGPDQLRRRLEELASRHGDRFQPDAGWQSL